MNKKELEFRKLLELLEPEFAEYMLEKDFKLLEQDGVTKINSFTFRKDYWSKPTDEVTINPNANLGNTGYKKNFCNLISEMASPTNKLAAMSLIRKYGNRRKVNGDKLVDSLISGELYHHNLTLYDLPYCVGLSLYPLTTDGLDFGGLHSNPPKRPTSFINLAVRYIQIASNHFAGATALTDVFANYSYYTSLMPNYTDKERENDFQNMIFGVNDEVRLSGQAPFTNVSLLGPQTIRTMFSNYMWGKDTKVDQILPEIMKNQQIYARFISKGQLDRNQKPIGLPYRFPITTLVADPSFEKEYPEYWDELLEGNANLCHLNFMSNMTTDLKSLAMCCRLTQNIEDLLKLNVNNTFGSYLQVGSHAVVSVNLPRIAFKCLKQGGGSFIGELETQCRQARELLKIHREDVLSARRLKYHYFFNKGYLNLKRNFFSTIGFVGLPNAVEIMGFKITEPAGKRLAQMILETMKKLSVDFSKEDGYMYNIEEVPAESTSGVLARKDKLYYPESTYEYYDSQFVPLSYDMDIFDRVDLEGDLQEFCTGGSISHINIQEGKPDQTAMKALTNVILHKTKLRQFAFNKGFTICDHGHTTQGIVQKCATCQAPAKDYITRVVGYFSPVSAWNKSKQKEFEKRRWQTL